LKRRSSSAGRIAAQVRPVASLIVLLAAAVALAGCAASGTRPAAHGCALVVAPGGDDGARGTVDAPLRTPQAVADRLRPGQTGCLRAGTYPGTGPNRYVLRFGHGGRPGAPLTVRSFPGERATLAGVVYVPRGSDFVTLADLAVNDPTPFALARQLTLQVTAADTVLEDLDVTNEGRKTCVGLGDATFGTAVRTVLRDSTLHDCGDPGNGLLDHGAYLSHTRDARIVDNVVTGTSGYGLHLYPSAQGTLVAGNVIARNGGGVIVAGEGDEASSGTLITGNVVAGSTRDFEVAAYWGDRVGTGNVVRGNCLFSADGRGIEPAPGLTDEGNATGDPGWARRPVRDYLALTVSSCRRATTAGAGATGAAPALR